MSIEINCNDANLNIVKVDQFEIKLTYANTEIKLYAHTKVQELQFKIYNCYDGKYKPECCIEIDLENGGGDFVFRFPHEYRYAVMHHYEHLYDLLKNFY